MIRHHITIYVILLCWYHLCYIESSSLSSEYRLELRGSRNDVAEDDHDQIVPKNRDLDRIQNEDIAFRGVVVETTPTPFPTVRTSSPRRTTTTTTLKPKIPTKAPTKTPSPTKTPASPPVPTTPSTLPTQAPPTETNPTTKEPESQNDGLGAASIIIIVVVAFMALNLIAWLAYCWLFGRGPGDAEVIKSYRSLKSQDTVGAQGQQTRRSELLAHTPKRLVYHESTSYPEIRAEKTPRRHQQTMQLIKSPRSPISPRERSSSQSSPRSGRTVRVTKSFE